MYFKSKLFAGIIISFILLLFSLYINFQGIIKTSKVIDSIERTQLKLTHEVSTLSRLVEENQVEVLEYIILNKGDINLRHEKYFTRLQEVVDNLSAINSCKNIKKIIAVIQSRIVSFKFVENSLIQALHEENKEDIKDAIIGFNTTAQMFGNDINKLVGLSYKELHREITELKNSNRTNYRDMLLSFLIAFILIFFSIYKLANLNRRLKVQLEKTVEAENEQRRLQLQLKDYNDNLEVEIERQRQEIYNKIYHNSISGLANRNKLLDDKAQKLFKAVVILDIDKFQKFNDVYGEKMGDIAIKLSAEYLHNSFIDDDILFYHINGDEFVYALKSFEHISRDQFLNKVENIIESYQKHLFHYESQEFQFVMSAGITFCGDDKMLAYADMALKDAKEKNVPLVVFNEDQELVNVHKETLECSKRLSTALESNNIISYFQPIIPLQDDTKEVKYESLVRLRDEDGTIIPPIAFLDVAKIDRVYHLVTHAVIHNTLEVIEKYKVPVTINFSLTDLSSKVTQNEFFSYLDRFEYNDLITVELLETEEISNYQKVYDFCLKLKSYNVKIAIDDFGSGYSNFAHIVNLPIDFIKIDATLISNIDRDENARIMVETIVSLAKRLGIETVAEFVSSEKIYSVVKELNVDYAQGYYQGKPAPIENYLG